MKERPSLAHSDGWKWKPSVLVFCLLLWQNNDQMQYKWAGNVWAPSFGRWSPPWWVSSSGCESGKQLVTWSFQLGIQKMRADAGLSSFFSYSVCPANLWVVLPSLVKPLWKQADMCYLGGSQPSQNDSEDRPYLPQCCTTSAPRKVSWECLSSKLRDVVRFLSSPQGQPSLHFGAVENISLDRWNFTKMHIAIQLH